MGKQDNNTNRTPLKDLRDDALKHYEEASECIQHWSSAIPKAIKFYYRLAMNREEKKKAMKLVYLSTIQDLEIAINNTTIFEFGRRKELHIRKNKYEILLDSVDEVVDFFE